MPVPRLVSEGVVDNILLALIAGGMCEIVGLILTSRLCVHVADVEVKTALIFLPLIIHLIHFQDGVKFLSEFAVHFTLLLTHNIISEENCGFIVLLTAEDVDCLLYTSPSPRDKRQSRMPSSA